MEQFPFAVDSDLSPIVAAAGDDSSSLVTASSQGSFVPTSEDDGMHSSSQQQMDDDDNEAVFANFTPVVTQVDRQHRQEIPAVSNQVPPNSAQAFNATIVELPPPTSQVSLPHRPIPSTVSTTGTSTIPISSVTAANTLLSGVDALKSAGSRVSSVLSHFGYSLGNNSTTTTIRTSNTTTTTPITITKQHYDPPSDSSTQQKNPNSAATTTVQEEATIDFAYINVTDEDEVDIWLDDSHANAYRYNKENSTFHGGTDDGLESLNGAHRPDILSVLLAHDTSSPVTTNEGIANISSVSYGDQLVQLTEQANEATANAAIARKNGNLQAALDRHSDAAKLYHQAAVHVRDRDGT
jgi:hypothetical protein